jgi:hypothetical protein
LGGENKELYQGIRQGMLCLYSMHYSSEIIGKFTTGTAYFE